MVYLDHDMQDKPELDPRLAARADFQPVEKIGDHKPMWRRDPHGIKIQRYRTNIIELMSAGVIDKGCFELFYKRSESLNTMLPDNSEIALYSDLHLYIGFCLANNLQMLPITDQALIAYIDSMIYENKSKSTVNRHVASLSWWCQFLSLDDPRKSYLMKLKLKKVRTLRRTGLRGGQAEALRYEHLEQSLEVFDPGIPRDSQDVCLLFVAFETLCRRSELVGLRWRHFVEQQDGTGLINIEFSKTDQTGEGEWLYISKNTTDLLLRWKSLVADSGPNTPIFRGVYSNGLLGDALSPDGVNRAFKRIALRLGLDYTAFSGHSTRVGAAQEMLERNVNAAKIMLSGRWKSMNMLTRYAAKINAKYSGMAELTNMFAEERKQQHKGPVLVNPRDLSALPDSE